jgi:hypothetical protein
MISMMVSKAMAAPASAVSNRLARVGVPIRYLNAPAAELLPIHRFPSMPIEASGP